MKWNGVLKIGLAATIVGVLAGLVYWKRAKPGLLPETQQAATVIDAPARQFSPTASAVGPTVAPVEQKQLLPPPSLTWERAADRLEFSRFADWARRYQAAATAEQKTAMEAEGVEFAQSRREALAELIKKDPRHALELTVPFSVRQRLPTSVESLLEERISARGDLMVIGAIPLPGRESEIQPISRSTTLGGTIYDAYPFGWWLDHDISTYDVPMNGIALADNAGHGILALSPHPVRLPDDAQEAAHLESKALGPICSISGNAATSRNEKTVIEVGGVAQLTCGLDHAVILDAQLIEAAAAANGPAIIGGPPLTGFDNYTTGRKRFLLMRPGFSDVTNTMADSQVTSHFNSFSNNMYEMSYGKLSFAGLGRGSDATPIMKLPGIASDYDNTGLGKLYDTCRGVAQTNYGFDLSQYDFFYVVTGGQPAAGYAGLGFVRGVGFHLANGYYGAGTASHEYGHNLGLNHANFWSTLGKTIIGTGNSIEYGDSNDPMGAAGPSPQHYGSRYKNYLTWIADADIVTVSSANSGTYRLYSLDIADVPGSLRGLRIVRNASQNYWVQFRQRFTSPAMANGVSLLWTGNGNQSSLLLDTRLDDTSNDEALVIGRTFSDTTLGMYITPIGKGHTYPESMDVVVNIGTFPTNLPPACVLTASSASPVVGQSVALNATATDPNGDPLAYAWDFGDGSYNGDNSPATAHTFLTAGEYVVQCTVSDMKGGTARDSVVVRVGSPAAFRVSGRVLKLNQQPLAGIKVFADATHAAFTDSDGTYSVAGLGAGSYTLDARETVSGSPTFIHPFFSNPVTVGPSLINMDFIVGTAAPPVTLVATGSIWKYLDNGTDQGTAWTASGFDDSSWASGPAQLGYGEGDEATVIGFGGNPNAKYITYYFRHGFSVPDPSVLTNITVSLLRDDGGIVYLNGVEIFRSNMPPGPVTYNTFASAVIDDQVYFSGPVQNGLLVPGANMLAVEIHQADVTSSDISFDVMLGAENFGVQPQGTVVYLTSPSSGSVLAAPTNVSLSAVALSTSTSFTNVQFFDGGTTLGESSSAPFSFLWNNAPIGNHTLTARAKNTNGQTVVSAVVKVSVIVPSSAPLPVSLSLIQTGAFWSFLAIASNAPALWAAPGFDDSLWPGGPAQFGYGEGDEATTVPYGTDGNNKWITSYYRHAFSINDPGAVTNLTLRLLRDDGAVVYLNGSEVLRDNIPPGPVSWGTLATNAADDGKVFYDFTINPATLTPGTNLLAVEIHQSLGSSSDVSFDLSLDALASTNRPRGVYLASPIEGATIISSDPVPILAQVVAGGTLGVTTVEFFADSVKIGEASSAPYSLAWNNSPIGAHQITVVATDTEGGSVTSAPVNIVVAAPALPSQLISLGDLWKYLDDGTDPGTAWRARIFNDSAWNEGAARLGYGGGEVTTVSFGLDPGYKHPATYFRHGFNVANPAAFSNLKLRLVRDDGAVVYLNGVEVFRSNMATGLISANSLALTTVNPPEETAVFETTLSPGTLVAGSNMVAVEVHQASVNSSDLGFDLALLGLKTTNLVQGVYLASPGNGAHFELPSNVALSAVAQAAAGISKVEFFDGLIKLGESTSAPFNLIWTNPPASSHTLTARATDNGSQSLTSAPISITVSASNLPTASIETLLFPSHSAWTYLDDGSNQGSNWTGRAFNDAGWKRAAARFGYGFDGEFTKLTNNITTHYFRKWFNATNPAVFTELLFRLQRDDGAVIHLNGQEIYRSNMPTGAVNSVTLASTTANSLDENYVFETLIPTPGAGLLLGSNLVAVELHQASATSSDAGFDLELWGLGTTEPRLYLSNPADGAALPLPVQIDAEAWAGNGRSISKVEFFEGANKIGEAASPPFSLTWFNPPLGTNRVSAVGTDDSGRLLHSGIATITVSQPPVITTLVATGSVWKFLDNGSNQGTNWSQRSYDDSTWASGPAELGYNNVPVTIVGFGPDPAHKYITTYFRHWFPVPADAVYTNFNLRLKRDDGGVVYLNGRELFRSNMPAGIITNQTLASSAVVIPDEETFFLTSMAATNLVAGTNVLAVEIHQNDPASGDLGFDIEFVASGYSIPATPPSLVLQRNGPSVKISWPPTAQIWRMYSAASLDPGAWSVLTATPSVIDGFNVLTVTSTNGNKFYQLRKP